jgi:Kef-type K+ transport system membrane component KefB
VINLSVHPVLSVMAIAVASSLLSEIRVGVRVPVVIWQMALGILVGPQGLAILHPGAVLTWLGDAGLTALFFMAGLELDLRRVQGRPLSLALRGWGLSCVLGFAAAALLSRFPVIHAPLIVALALITTAMGTFMPILRDAGKLDSRFGSFVLAAGAVGEFGPIVAVSLVLTRVYAAWQEFILMIGFGLVALAAAFATLRMKKNSTVLGLLERGMHSSAQLPVALSLLLMAAFSVASKGIGFERVLGAFAAGMVVGLASREEAGKVFREKMEAVCFGFFVPFFFVSSAIGLDLAALLHTATTMLLVLTFLTLFLVVRGAPAFLYRNDLAKGERWPFALYSATTLPLVVAITSIGVRGGSMQPDVAAGLVGAAVLSVLLFPTVANALLSRAARG